MLSRALSLATVTLLISCFAAVPAQAQAQNLEAGKSPSQIFAGTCSACHKSPRGLLKTVAVGSLPGFLRQHYTTSSDMASLLSAFLTSNGATDTRYIGAQSKPDKDAKPEARPAVAPEPPDRYGHRPRASVPPQEAARPEPQQAEQPADDELPPQADPKRHGRNAKRQARPGEATDAAKPAVDRQAPAAQAASERGPEGRKSAAKQKLGKRGRPGSEEPPKTDAAKTDASRTDASKTDAAKTDARDEPAKDEPLSDDKSQSDTAKYGGRPEGTSPAGEDKPEGAKLDMPKPNGSGDTATSRPDQLSPVTPAPRAPTAVSGGAPEPWGGTATAATAPAAPSVTASVPPPAPAAPAGPPTPPISK
jgi:hypothetical protein